MFGRYVFLSILLISSTLIFAQKTRNYDVIVYGGSSAGVTAAIQASKMKRSVLLIAQDGVVGGLTVSGLGATDINRKNAIGGIARDFYKKVYAYYLNDTAWKNETRTEYFEKITKRVFSGKDDAQKMQWVFEPKVAQRLLRAMLNETMVDLIENARLDLKSGVKLKGQQITSIKLLDGSSYAAKIFIDASYEGDLMAKAGVSYTVGRESNSKYDEKHNGVKYGKLMGKNGKSVDPYIKQGDPGSGLLPFIEADLGLTDGDADHRIQAYCYRFTLTSDKNNQLPIEKPADYNPLWYEYIARRLALIPTLDLKDNLLSLTPMPNRKTDTNHADFIGACYNWPDGDYNTREKLAKMHKSYTLGLVWFFANDPRVPENIREEMKLYGLAKDEFTDSQNFPKQIYVREARRMVSDYVMTEKNYFHQTEAEDAVALGTYWLDSHVVSHAIAASGKLVVEGNFWVSPSSTYAVSYRAIVPSEKECNNLLVPVCLSASHSAYGSIRMEPVYMVLGQSAGAAAALAIEQKSTVQKLDYQLLKQRLLAENQILSN